MTNDKTRVEIAARAMARHRLGRPGLGLEADTEVGQRLLNGAVERLWPELAQEAREVIEALDSTLVPRGPSEHDPQTE